MLFYYFDTESLLLKYAQKKLKLWHNQGLQNPKVCLLKVNIFKESLIRKSTLITLFILLNSVKFLSVWTESSGFLHSQSISFEQNWNIKSQNLHFREGFVKSKFKKYLTTNCSSVNLWGLTADCEEFSCDWLNDEQFLVRYPIKLPF